MIFPFDRLMTDNAEIGLALAVLLGMAFGFVLERAGFGRAPKLAAQFYFRDMTVLKVMFGAIVTALLGLVLLSELGLADWQAIVTHTASYTWLVPAVVGGLLLGVGFIVSGYCPGTSVVAAASGNLDGLVTVTGVVLGSLLYGELVPYTGDFVNMTAMGHQFLDQMLGVPPALLAIGVAVMAVGAFLAAEVAEQRFGTADTPPPLLLRPGRNVAFSTIGALSAAALLAMFVGPSPARATADKRIDPISPADLAVKVLEEPWKVRVLDLRSVEACAARRIPGAECVGPDGLADLGLQFTTGERELVLVDYRSAVETADVGLALLYPGRVRYLEGGCEAWRAYAFTEPPPLAPDATVAERAEWQRRAGLVSALTGMKQAPPPPVAKVAAGPVKGGGGGCQ